MYVDIVELRNNGMKVGYRVAERGKRTIDIGIAYEKGSEGGILQKVIKEYIKKKGELRKDYLVEIEGGIYISESELGGEHIEDRTGDKGLGEYLKELIVTINNM